MKNHIEPKFICVGSTPPALLMPKGLEGLQQPARAGNLAGVPMEDSVSRTRKIREREGVVTFPVSHEPKV